MSLQDDMRLIGTLDNASGQICQMKDDKPDLILFEFGCPACSEIAGKNADDYGESLAAIVNRAPQLYAACQAAIDFYAWHMNAVPSAVLEELTDRRAALQKQLQEAIKP